MGAVAAEEEDDKERTTGEEAGRGGYQGEIRGGEGMGISCSFSSSLSSWLADSSSAVEPSSSALFYC